MANSIKTWQVKCQKCLDENNLNGFDTETELKKLKASEHLKVITNICFAGGGMKCVGYLGAIAVLDELDLLKNIKRFAGTSGGAMTALLCSLNYSVDEIYNIVTADQSKYLDRKYKILNWWYYLCRKNFGIYRGQIIEDDIKSFINKKFDKDWPNFRCNQSPDYNPTFKDIYEKYGHELIVTGTNLSSQNVEYFCPKLTPDMPVYIAIRISMSIPALFESVIYKGSLYVDGGMCENYPLDVFCNQSNYIFAEEKESTINNSLGFTFMTSGTKILRDSNMNDVIENDSNTSITSLSMFMTSIVDFYCTRNLEDEMHFINKNNPDEPNCFINHTVPAYTPCLSITDFTASMSNKLDAMGVLKMVTIRHLLNKYKL